MKTCFWKSFRATFKKNGSGAVFFHVIRCIYTCYEEKLFHTQLSKKIEKFSKNVSLIEKISIQHFKNFFQLRPKKKKRSQTKNFQNFSNLFWVENQKKLKNLKNKIPTFHTDVITKFLKWKKKRWYTPIIVCLDKI